MDPDRLLIPANTGTSITSLLLAPGEFLVALLARVTPAPTASILGLDAGAADIAAAVLSILFWLAAGITASRTASFLGDTLRAALGMLRSGTDMITVRVRRARIFLACQLFRLRSWRSRAGLAVAREIELGPLEIEVLRRQGALAPGHVLTAQELGELLGVLPSRAELALRRLEQCEFVAHTFGSMDGYDGYRITPPGELYLQAVARG